METNREGNSDAITKQLVQRERELLAARRISEALFQHLTLDDLVDRALRTAVDVVNAETGSVILADPDSHELVFRYTLWERCRPHVEQPFLPTAAWPEPSLPRVNR